MNERFLGETFIHVFMSAKSENKDGIHLQLGLYLESIHVV